MADDRGVAGCGGLAARDGGPTIFTPDDGVDVHAPSFVFVVLPISMVEEPVLSCIVGDELGVVSRADETLVIGA